MDTKRYINSNLVAGGLLILLGLLFLAVTQGAFNLNWGNFWPVVPVAVGLYLLMLAVVTPDRSRRAGLVLGGTIPLLVGLFFFTTTLGFIGWEAQGRLWPVYPLIVGVAFFGAYVTSGLHRAYLVPATVLSVVGLGLLALTIADPTYEYLSKFWPAMLIVAGVVLLIPGLARADAHNPKNS